MLDVESLVTSEDRVGSEYKWFTLDPSVVYPVVIERIEEIIKTGEIPEELVDLNSPLEVDPRSLARRYVTQAKMIPAQSWKDALKSKDGLKDPERVIARAQALELARLWFTQALHVWVGGNGTPLGVHWTKDLKYRL